MYIFWMDDGIDPQSKVGSWTNSLWMDDGIDPQSKVGLGRIVFGWMMVLIHDHNWALDGCTLDG
jgi:hypothetical protein